MAKRRKTTGIIQPAVAGYDGLVGGIADLLEQSRRTTARTINSILMATYWEIGRRIVEHEQGGQARAEYGAELLKRLAGDLTARFGRGYSKRNLEQMRVFYVGWEIAQTPSAQFEARVRLPAELLEATGDICQTASGKLPILQTPSAKSQIAQTPSVEFGGPLFTAFPLAWSHYAKLMSRSTS